MHKNNQSKRRFANLTGKSDDVIIHNLQRFLIQNYKLKVIIEPFLLFQDERYMGFSRSFTLQQIKDKELRHPDLFLPSKNIIIEVDGKIHGIKKTNTEKRNEMYVKAGFHLIVLDLEELAFFKTNIYDKLETELVKYLYVVI